MIIIDYFLSSIYIVWFYLMLVIFHPLQYIAYTFISPKAHRRVVEGLNFFLLYGLYFTGQRIRFENKSILPKGKPVIIVANHQSLYDIIGIIWFLRAIDPIFVSKKVLAKGIPSISYNLRKSGAALINRGDRRQALSEIKKLSERIELNNETAVIFPEGTRSKKGIKPFQKGGITSMLKYAPSALIIPVAIHGTGRMDAYKTYPIRTFQKIKFTALPVYDPKGKAVDEVIGEVHELIRNELK